jgi:hypothetical protein
LSPDSARRTPRYDGHAPGRPSLNNRVSQAEHRAKRKPLIKRADATDDEDRRDSKSR